MAQIRVVLWKPLILTVAALVGLSIFTYFFNTKLSIILVLAALGIISRIPAGYSTYLNPLEMIDFFGVSIALAYGPIIGSIFSLTTFLFSRLFLPGEWPMYTIKWALTIAMGAPIFYFLFPLVGNISTLFTMMIIWNMISYTWILTPLLEREALMTEMYYDIALAPMAILHRIIISAIGGEFLHELLISGSTKIVYVYIFAIVFATILWFGKAILKKFNDYINRTKVFDVDRKAAIEAVVEKTGFDFGEARALIVAVIALAIALSAGQWGAGDVFDAGEGIKNLFIAIPVVALSLFAHEKAHKWAAQRYGAYAKFEPSWPAMAFSAVIGIISGGWAIMTAVGSSLVKQFKRIGFKFVWFGPTYQAKMVVLGPFISLMLVVFAKVMMGYFGETTLLKDLFRFNLWMTFFNMIPLVVPYEKGGIEKPIFPGFDGAYVLGGNPKLYVGFLAFAIAVVAGIYFLHWWVALGLGFLIGFIIWVLAHAEEKPKGGEGHGRGSLYTHPKGG